MFIQTHDGSVLDRHGRVLYFSLERFIADIARGDCCFICGASPHDAAFNDEHVMPDWILRRYKLHDKSIGLPNEAGMKYSQ
jgi:hypothetical protein